MELINVLSKFLDRPVNTACNLIEALLGEPFRIAGDALADNVRMWQWKNRVCIFDRAEEIMRQRGIKTRQLSPDFLLPFIRDCGDMSTKTLQETWARLLAAAVDDKSNEHIAFVNTLRSLSAADIQVLNCLIELGYMERKHRVPTVSNHLGLSTDSVQLSIYNLEHLGFFTPTQRHLKGFAVRFMHACMIDSKALYRYKESEKVAKPKVVVD